MVGFIFPGAKQPTAQQQAERVKRDELIEQAKADFPQIAEKLHRQDISVQGLHSDTLYISPLAYVAGRSIGLSSSDIVREIAAQQKAPVAAKEMDYSDSICTMKGSNLSGQFVKITSFNPTAISLEMADGIATRAVFPASFAHSALFASFPKDKVSRLINLHEQAHVDDRIYIGEMDKHQQTAVYDFDPKRVNDNQYTQFICLTHKAEIFADLTALGMMVTEGEDPEIVEKLQLEREKSVDLGHNTSRGLAAFTAQIKEMGLDQFRRMNGSQQNQLYHNLIEKTGLTKEDLEQSVNVKTVEDMAPNIDMVKTYLSQQQPVDKSNFIDISASVEGELPLYHVLEDMQMHAYAAYGELTPTTYAQAFGDKMHALEREKRANPDRAETLTTRQIATQSVFEEAVYRTNYINRNEELTQLFTQNESDFLVVNPAKNPQPHTLKSRLTVN